MNMSNACRVRIVPLGTIDPLLIQWLKQNVETRDEFVVFIEPQKEFPPGAYERHRNQYLGDVVLAFLRQLRNHTGDTLLGIADVDCYTDSLNYIFGQASLNGHEAFVTVYRLHEKYLSGSGFDIFKKRVLTEVIHELGHTMGLLHCENPLCVMHFSRSITDTDRKGPDYCEKCQKISKQGEYIKKK